LLHYYLQKGIDPDVILNMPLSKKQFYQASMLQAFEEEEEKYKALFPSSS
jgi:hypothetical protein